MDIDTVRSRLIRMRNEVDDLLQSLGEPEATFPEKSRELVSAGICLDCGKPIGDDATASRGLHGRCYRRIKRLIEVGELAEDEAVRAGVLAPKRTGGPQRKQTRVQEYLTARDTSELALRVAEGHADIDRAIARDEAEQAGMAPKRPRRRKAN